MNTYVNFEIAKLLKQKECVIKPLGLKNKTDYVEGYEWDYEDDVKITEFQFEDHVFYFMYLKPTIAEVVMWLYENHGIWICVDKAEDFNWWKFSIRKLNDIGYERIGFGSDYNSPTEAYEGAITYTLENIIKGGNK
jgi:hypothetical protein